MAEPQRLLLAREDRVALLERRGLGLSEFGGLVPALLQRVFQLVGMVEVILDHALVAAGDEYELLDPRGQAFLYRILDQRPVDDREHFFRHRLGGGQETGAEAGHRQNGFTDALRHYSSCLVWGCELMTYGRPCWQVTGPKGHLSPG